MKRNWFIGFILIAVMALGVGCADGGSVVQPPEGGLQDAEINLIVHGDFEGVKVDENGNLNLGWGGVAGGYSIAADEGEGNYIVLNAQEGEANIFRANPFDFSGTSGVFSAKIKLANEADASKVRLIVEKKNNQDQLIEDATIGGEAKETTEWQTISVNVDKTDSNIFNSVFQVKVESGAEEVVYVDDVKFIVDDPTAVNFLGSANFAAGDLKNNGNSQKWKLAGADVGTEGYEFPATEEAVTLTTGQTLETANEWFAGGSNNVDYPLNAADYPNIYDGTFSVEAEGNGNITLRVEIKRPASKYTQDNLTTLDITKDYTVSGSGTFSIDIPRQGEEHNETVVHVTCNSGEVTINRASLKLVD